MILLSMKRDSIELGTLNVAVLFKKYFFPTLLGMLSISAVTTIDGIFVGHGIGSDGIAAINICIPLLMFFTGIGLILGGGCSVVASIHLSRKKVKAARLNITQALLIVSLLVAALSILIMMFPKETAKILGASEHLSPMVVDYLMWSVPSWTFQMWTTISLFIIRLDGAPKLAMCCSLIAALLNVILDWLFIFPLNWGITGAAFATSISVIAGSLIAIIYLLHYAERLRLCLIKISIKSIRLMIRNIDYQCRIGFSAFLTEMTLATLMFMGNVIFMKYLGDNGVAAFGIACYYIPFVFMIGNAIAQSAQPIISYNWGLGYAKRVMTTERIALATSIVCGGIITFIFCFFPHSLVGLFISLDEETASIAINGFPYFSIAFIFFILNLCIIGYYQSVERIKSAIFYAVFRGFIFLIPCFILLPKLIGVKGIWLALAASEILTIALIIIKYKIHNNK